MRWSVFSAVVGAAFLAGRGPGAVQLPDVFGDNMVLQEGAATPIFGTGKPGEKVAVSLDKQTVSATADGAGHWATTLRDLKAGGPYTLTVSGSNTVTFSNVLVGEVWFCAGQSNMGLEVRQAKDAEKEIGAANFPQVRLLEQLQRPENGGYPGRAAVKWEAVTPESVASFSAVAYYFGRDLHQALHVPVGLIHASVGGSQIEGWIAREDLEKEPEAGPILERWAATMADYPKNLERYNAAHAGWEKAVVAAKAAGKEPPKEPARRFVGPGNTYEPGGHFTHFVAPILGYGIRGVVWYQGESSVSRAYQYRTLFPLMINSWRQHWGEGDFSFLYVELPGYGTAVSATQPGTAAADTNWAELREAQVMALRVPNTAMVSIFDSITDPRQIHPKDKQTPGMRLALAAENVAYGRKDVEYSGPLFESMSIEGDKVRVHFRHAAGGLELRGEAGGTFLIAGADKQLVPASVSVEGETLVLHSDQVPQPVSVRYAWAPAPNVTLFNHAGFPASPFRTDTWPGGTVGKR